MSTKMASLEEIRDQIAVSTEEVFDALDELLRRPDRNSDETAAYFRARLTCLKKAVCDYAPLLDSVANQLPAHTADALRQVVHMARQTLDEQLETLSTGGTRATNEISFRPPDDAATLHEILLKAEVASAELLTVAVEVRARLVSIATERLLLGELRGPVDGLRNTVRDWQRTVGRMYSRDGVSRDDTLRAEQLLGLLDKDSDALFWKLFEFRN